MTPEAKCKIKIRQWYKDNLPNHWRLSPRGGPFGKAGAPDDIICYRGVFIAIEIKSDVGEPTSLQIMQLKLIKEAEGIAAIVRGYDVPRLLAIKKAADNLADRRTA